MTKLQIASDLSLPLEAVTQTLVVYGGKGMGKTNFGSVLVEELAHAGLRFSVIDPLGVSWGLRHSADGKSPGVEVLMLGGVHGDIPIEPTGGAVVADLVADEEVNVVIDISRKSGGQMWGANERIRFVADYCARLFERQGERRRPLMQVIDEAGRFVPQTIPSGAVDLARCVGAVEQLVEWGRNVGVGVTLITQRSARMNKSVSELAELMIAFRTVGPRSMDAVLDWLGEHVEKARLKEIGETLRSLPVGKALVISPGWLKYEGVAAIRRRETFDSSATPKPGQSERAPGRAAKPNLARYQERMAATIEKARADDPQILRKRIAELERQLRTPKTAEIDKSVIDAAVEAGGQRWKRELEEARRRYEARIKALRDQLETARDLAMRIAETTTGYLEPPVETSTAIVTREQRRKLQKLLEPKGPPPITPPARPLPSPSAAKSNGSQPLSKTERAILTVLAQYPQRTKIQIGILSGYSHNSGGFNGAIARLRAQGWIEGSAGAMRITAAGKGAVGQVEELPMGDALVAYWLNKLTGCSRAILEHLTFVYPDSMTKEELGEATGYSHNSGGFNAALAELRALELIKKGRDIEASEVFFE